MFNTTLDARGLGSGIDGGVPQQQATAPLSLDSIIIIAASAGGILLIVLLVVLYLRCKKSDKTPDKIPHKPIYIIGGNNEASDNNMQTTQLTAGRTAIAVPIYLEFQFQKTLVKIKKIGQGGAGQVWLCESCKSAKAAAKIFHSIKHCLIKETSEKQFLKEVTIGNALNKHANFTIPCGYTMEVLPLLTIAILHHLSVLPNKPTPNYPRPKIPPRRLQETNPAPLEANIIRHVIYAQKGHCKPFH